MAEPTVGAGYANALMNLAVSKGADCTELCNRSHIQSEDLDDQDNRIPFESFMALMRAGQDLCNDPALALHFGESSTLDEISIVGLICRTVETMAEAWVQVNRYGRLVVEVDGTEGSDRFQMSRSIEGVWVVDIRKNPNSFPELTESGFARMISEFRMEFPDVPFAKAVHVTHPEPAYRSEYDRILKVPVVFNSDKNAILIHESFLTLKIPPANKYTFGILSDRANGLMQSLEKSKTIKGQVESLLIPILHKGDLRMELIASKLGFSRQMLYRKLKAEGTNYEKLLDQLRHQMALHYLSGKKVSVNETAYLVGFSDPSAFSRAFKRWTGNPPGRITA